MYGLTKVGGTGAGAQEDVGRVARARDGTPRLGMRGRGRLVARWWREPGPPLGQAIEWQQALPAAQTAGHQERERSPGSADLMQGVSPITHLPGAPRVPTTHPGLCVQFAGLTSPPVLHGP